jgi:hypothetical protein
MPAEQTVNECQRRYSALRMDVEEKAVPIREVRQHPLALDELCNAITSYEEATLKIIGYVDANAKKCGFSSRLSRQLIDTYAGAAALKDKACPKPKMRFG